MSVLPDDPAQRSAYWPLPIARAVPAAVLAGIITFSADHSATLGLISFGGFALVTGVLLAVLAWRRLGGMAVRPYLLAQGIVSIALGALALALPRGVPSLFLVVTVWAALTGALELYSGLRARRRHVASGDLLTVGAITAAAAIVFVLIPPEFAQQFTGPDGVERKLDSAVVAVGLLGAYAAIIAVFLVIAGLSAKWGTQKAAPAASDAVKGKST
ncbi:hypothetical protein [Marisediminicola antarctica]|uniref:Acyl-CoA synthetase n=1 Tax=Marisediminicola antarctica TaxID=674079 RepID=A0A7L5AFA9_9MICO|nr:hypothetical protein [Marisediminicola antarctica]QHO68586.1 hypothetical protein BHD05_02010 [Marisediminicola antarctica]